MGTGRVQDKTDKTDSNQRRTIDVSSVWSIKRFAQVIKLLMDLLNGNKHGTGMLNINHIENGGHWQISLDFVQFQSISTIQ